MGYVAKMLLEVPCGEAGESVAIQMGFVGERSLILSVLNPQSPKDSRLLSVNKGALKVLGELQKALRASIKGS